MKLVIATPVRTSDHRTAIISVGYMNFVIAMIKRGADYCGGQITFGADIVRGRNRVAAKILREMPDFTHILWVDDDQWPEDMGMVDRLVDSGEDLIGAAYTNKQEPLRWVMQPWDHRPGPDERGIVDVRGIGFGFTLTTKRCIETMSASARRYWDLPHEVEVADIFGQLYDDFGGMQCLMGEDYSFCKRWRDLSGRVKVHTCGVIYHSGAKAFSARDIR